MVGRAHGQDKWAHKTHPVGTTSDEPSAWDARTLLQPARSTNVSWPNKMSPEWNERGTVAEGAAHESSCQAAVSIAQRRCTHGCADARQVNLCDATTPRTHAGDHDAPLSGSCRSTCSVKMLWPR